MIPIDDISHSTISNAVSRRTALRGLGGVGMATALGLATPHGLHADEIASTTMIEPPWIVFPTGTRDHPATAGMNWPCSRRCGQEWRWIPTASCRC
jgi:hypothetical protein